MKDGGPVFPCSKCGGLVEFRAEWQRKDRRCLLCKRKQQNAANVAKGELLKVEGRAAYRRRRPYYAAYWKARRTDPLHLLQRKARRKVATEIEAGRLERKPCEVCDGTPADAHHENYSKALDIRWLCRRCHFAEERKTIWL